eukprot:4010195-Amphidinium_carterae.1
MAGWQKFNQAKDLVANVLGEIRLIALSQTIIEEWAALLQVGRKEDLDTCAGRRPAPCESLSYSRHLSASANRRESNNAP